MADMSTFVESDHPRGHPRNAGAFTDKTHTAPETTLDQDAEIREALTKIEKHARKYAARYRFDDSTREDIVQDTILDLLAQQKRHGTAKITQPALLNAATRAVASRYIDPEAHHIDLTARVLLNETVALEEEALGRPVTSRERITLADDLRMKVFNPSHRPHADFHETRRVISLDKIVTGGVDTTLGDLIAIEEVDRPYATDTTDLADYVDGLDLHDSRAMTAAKRDVWNRLAAPNGIPTVTPGTLTRKAAATARGIIRNYPGGIPQLCRDWETGDSADTDNTALFAPFGDIGNTERARIVTHLLQQPAYAEDLWTSAASNASQPKPAAGYVTAASAPSPKRK